MLDNKFHQNKTFGVTVPNAVEKILSCGKNVKTCFDPDDVKYH